MKKRFILLATLAALFAAPAIADSDDGGGNSVNTDGAFGDGSSSNGGVVASTQGGFGSGF